MGRRTRDPAADPVAACIRKALSVTSTPKGRADARIGADPRNAGSCMPAALRRRASSLARGLTLTMSMSQLSSPEGLVLIAKGDEEVLPRRLEAVGTASRPLGGKGGREALAGRSSCFLQQDPAVAKQRRA